MTEYGWVSVVALAGWLVLALSSWRAHRVGAGKTAVIVLAWIAIFLAAVGFFALIRA